MLAVGSSPSSRSAASTRSGRSSAAQKLTCFEPATSSRAISARNPSKRNDRRDFFTGTARNPGVRLMTSSRNACWAYELLRSAGGARSMASKKARISGAASEKGAASGRPKAQARWLPWPAAASRPAARHGSWRCAANARAPDTLFAAVRRKLRGGSDPLSQFRDRRQSIAIPSEAAPGGRHQARKLFRSPFALRATGRRFGPGLLFPRKFGPSMKSTTPGTTWRLRLRGYPCDRL